MDSLMRRTPVLKKDPENGLFWTYGHVLSPAAVASNA
jgi:hypothetical protein